MKAFAVADCETDPFKHGNFVKPFIWGFYNGTVYRKFYDTKEFVAFVRTQDVILYAHNGGKFDWRLLEEHLDDGPIKVISGRLAEARMGKATLRDSYNLMPGSLDRITGAKTKIDYDKHKASRRRFYKEEIEDYLFNDCVILYEALEKYFSTYGRSLTLAGGALKFWRGMGGEVPKLGPAHHAKFEPFYHGGRCEAIEPGHHKGKFFFLDINGAYAYAMTFDQYHGTPVETSRPRKSDYERCLFHIRAASKAAFALRENGNLSFPTGTYEFFVTGRELQTSQRLGLCSNVEILKAFRFEQTINFGAYIRHFEAVRNEAKKNGDTTANEIAKLFRNSIYGKMAADPNKYYEWYLCQMGAKPPVLAGSLPWRIGGMMGDKDVYKRELPEHAKTFYDVALAAFITGHVRSILMEARATVTRPMYCDTDSLICENPGKLKLGDNLGEWKIESIGKECVINGKKLYSFRHDNKAREAVGLAKAKSPVKVASKGAVLDHKAMLKLSKGKTVSYRQDAPTYTMSGVKFVKRQIRSTCKVG